MMMLFLCSLLCSIWLAASVPMAANLALPAAEVLEDTALSWSKDARTLGRVATDDKAMPPPIEIDLSASGGASERQANCMNFDQATGNLTSINHPADYTNNLNCAFNFSTDAGLKIRLTCFTFSLQQCYYDELRLQDIPGSFYRLCGVLPPFYFISTSNYLLVWFITDSAIVDSGFHCHVGAVSP